MLSLSRWILAALISASRTSRRASRTRRLARLGLEVLEDRTVLSTLHWQGDVSTAWSDLNNWQEAQAPVDSDTVVFDTATPGFTSFSSDNDISGLDLAGISIVDAATGNFNITGSAVTLAGGGLTHNQTGGGSATILNLSSITLAAAASFTNSAGGLTVTSPIANGGFTLTLDGASLLTILDGALSGGGTLVKQGSGTARLNADSTSFSGAAQVNAGQLYAFAEAALGPFLSSTTTVASGATLMFSFFGGGEPLILAGGTITLDGSGSGTIGGGITLTADSFVNSPGSNIFGIVGPSGGIGITDGAGSFGVTFSGSGGVDLLRANTYDGPTVVNVARLLVRADGGLGSTNAGTTVAGGAAIIFIGVNYQTAEAVTLNGGAIASQQGAITFVGDVTLGANSVLGHRFDDVTNSLTLTGAITDGASTFGLNKIG